jgi:hypothetical protein
MGVLGTPGNLLDSFFEATELDEFIADFEIEFDLFGYVVVDREDGAEELLELAERSRRLDALGLVDFQEDFRRVLGSADSCLEVGMFCAAVKDERDTAFDFARVLDDQATGFVDFGIVVEVAAEDVVESLGELLVVEEGFFLLNEGGEIHL